MFVFFVKFVIDEICYVVVSIVGFVLMMRDMKLDLCEDDINVVVC